MVARGISFCLISAEKRQVSQKKISDEASEPSPLSTLIHSIPALSFCQHTEQTSHFFTGLLRGTPSCITCNPPFDWASYPGIELAPSWAARSGSGLYLETPILEYPYMRIILIWPPYNTFLSKCQGFFCLFLPSFFGYFSWHFMLNLSY